MQLKLTKNIKFL